ncbi:AAA ATPase, CDC48 sub [Lobosporangium transversale]|nr:AAA ATPase, CDC48 sub [Lobosporangium transversale]
MYPGDLLKGLKMYLGSIKHHSKAVGRLSYILILDNIELIFPREESDFALVYAFQSWINDLVEQELSTSSSTFSSNHISSPSIKGSAAPRVIVLGLTQDARGLDPSVASLFDDSIELDIPTPEERCLILTACARNHGISLQPQEQKYEHEQQQQQTEGDGSTFAIDHVKSSEILDTKEWLQVSLEPIAAKCHGYLAADLDALCRQAAIIAYQRHERTMDQLTVQDFIEAMKTIKVSALRQSTSVQKVDPVYWSDIGGLEEVKKTLEESVIWLYKHSEAFKRMGISPSKGVLLYGPPGTGKTMLAKAVATESEANFMAVVVPDLIKGEVGESEKAIAKVFKMATRCSPCIIFLDELEAIFGARESSGGLGKQLLLEMDNCGEGVVVLAATNHPEVIDSSILRPGRLDRLVYVPPPTFEERVAILQILKQSTRISSSVDLRTVGNLTNCFTGADIKALVRRSGLLALRANRTSIEPQDFFTASSEIRPSVNQFDLLRYENFHQ